MRYVLAVVTFFALLLFPVLALAQASQPASQPATPTTVMAWLSTWWPLVALFVVPLLISLINALIKYVPKATGWITALRILVDVLSFWGNKDSATAATVPGKRSVPPATSPPKA